MYLKLAWRNIWRNKKRSIITIASVLFAYFFAVGMRTMQFGTYDSMIENVVGVHTGYLQIHKKGYQEDQILENSFEDSPKIQNILKNNPKLLSASPRMEGFALAAGTGTTRGVAVVGVDPEVEFSDLVSANKIVEGNNITAESRGILLAEGLAKILEIGVNDTLVLLGQGYQGMSAAGTYPVEGIVELKNPQLNEAFVIMPLLQAQDFYYAHGRLTAYALMPQEGISYAEIKTDLATALDHNQYEVMDWEELMPELVQGIQADSAGGLIMLYILYLIISFGIFGTFIMLTHERRYEFGVMISVGMKRARLMIVLLLEIILMSIVGVGAGILCTWPVVYYFNRNPIELTGQAAAAMKDYGMEPLIPTALDMDVFITHGGVILLVSLILASYPLTYVYRLKVVKALRG